MIVFNRFSVSYTLAFILLLSFAFFSSVNAQSFCDDFNHQTTGNWVGTGVGTAIPSNGPGTLPDWYLQGPDLPSGPSILTNNVDYIGDWTTRLGECLCFDFYLEVPGGGPPFPLQIEIRNPGGALTARFVTNFTVTLSHQWIHVCAPLEMCSGGGLPSNAQGSWTGINCTDWSTLLSNVGSVALIFDLTPGIGEVVGYDNICIQSCGNNDAAYCCDSLPNLINNGNFEGGNVGFTSDYIYQPVPSGPPVLPGMYTVTDAPTAADLCESWIADDHSGCQGYPNTQVMYVNGRTQQASGGNDVVWRQTITGLEIDSTYKFCGQFKDLPSCCYDVLPSVNIEFEAVATIPYTTINTDHNDPCDWQQLEITFKAVTSSITIHISLDETGVADGNDLAIDDLSLMKLHAAPVNISVQHQGGSPNIVTASINSILSGDDALPHPSCGYLWTVSEASGGGVQTGNQNSPTPWNLTTTFPFYNFQAGILCRIELSITDCPCNADNSTYQLTFSANRMMVQMGDISYSLKDLEELMWQTNPHDAEQMQHLFQQYKDENAELASVKFFPNPSTGLLNVTTEGEEAKLEFCNENGQVLENWKASRSQQFDIGGYPSGNYFIRYQIGKSSGVEKIVLQR